MQFIVFFFFSSRRRHTRLQGDWSSDVCSSDLSWWRVALVRRRGSGGGENRARLGIALQPSQVGAYFGGTLITEFAIFFEQLVEDFFEVRGNIGVEPDRWRRRPVQNGVKDYSGGVSAKRNRARGHFVEDRAEGKQVAA